MTDDDTRWVGWVRAEHRTGAIFALAGVFSTRGVNVDSMATGDVHDDAGLVVVTFRAGERRARLLTRTLERLPQVHSVRVCRADDPDVRAAAVVHLPRGVPFVPRRTLPSAGRGRRRRDSRCSSRGPSPTSR